MKNSVIITGGSAGIGKATVEKFIAQDYEVYNLDLEPSNLDSELVHDLICDVAEPASIQNAMNHILNKISHLKVVVACAGIYLSAPIEDTSETEFDALININLKGTFFLLKSVIPFMKQQKSGSIVLVGSDQSLVGKTRSAAYAATKGAVGQLTKAAALDLAPYHIRVNAVCPGTIDTPLYHHAIERTSERTRIGLDKLQAELASMQPLQRIGQPAEVAELIYFLGSDQASFMTGGLYPVDGGYTAQ